MEGSLGFWFRRDLRLSDNHGLYRALKSGKPVLPFFIFDSEILNELHPNDQRVSLIHHLLENLNQVLSLHGSGLQVFYGKPQELWPQICQQYDLKEVFTNADYEPYALNRDAEVKSLLKDLDVEFQSFTDHVLVEPGNVLKADGNPYSVYTPFYKIWKTKVGKVKPFPSMEHLGALKPVKPKLLGLREIGFEKTSFELMPPALKQSQVASYSENRDRPDWDATSHLSVHLRFGTIGIRDVFRRVEAYSETLVKELAWREFFIHVLFHHPRLVHSSFRTKYEHIAWRNNEEEFEKWCKGETGYSMVDAGMRQLNETGWMHNRVRMIVASFLTKHLLIDWRWGEAYFAEKLLDYELASNNGNWQWAAGCGCDAAPYFRIFNPITQAEKFDPHGVYRKKYIQDWSLPSYPDYMVDHSKARVRCLKTFEDSLKSV